MKQKTTIRKQKDICWTAMRESAQQRYCLFSPVEYTVQSFFAITIVDYDQARREIDDDG
jgi:hypothetical protein